MPSKQEVAVVTYIGISNMKQNLAVHQYTLGLHDDELAALYEVLEPIMLRVNVLAHTKDMP